MRRAVYMFPGVETIEPIARAVAAGRAAELAAALAECNARGAFDDARFSPPLADRYARRLLWRDPHGRFIVSCMTWAPGQSAPLHDHAGLWGAEIVVDGVMCESSYRAVEREGRRTRFLNERETVYGPRSIGILEPPNEYHAYANVGSTVARTVHVYAGLYETCTTFVHDRDDWWIGEPAALAYDVSALERPAAETGVRRLA